jgi:hypothetical protein
LIGGGFTPIVATALYAQFDSFVPVALLVLVAAALTGASILVLTENRSGEDGTTSTPNTTAGAGSTSVVA